MRKIGLVGRLIIAILAGILMGSFFPPFLIRITITFAEIFSSFLKFIIPLMILGFIIVGIADLGHGAGKLLAITTGIAYGSTIAAGTLSYFMATLILPLFINSASHGVVDPEAGMLTPYFPISMPPLLDLSQALVFAFTFGLCIATLRHLANENNNGETFYKAVSDFSASVNLILAKVIIPLLPFYICGTFANLTYSGQVFHILSIFWRVFFLVITLQVAYLFVGFLTAGAIGGKNPFALMRNQIPGYLTAIGTQSSAATIPVNLACAEKNKVSKGIRNFVVPLCATIHLCGSVITITSCVVAVLMMNNMDYNLATFFPFLLTLGVAMVAAPGAPGGAIMAALPFLAMVGIPPEGTLASLLIALYITQDSFGTAANVSGDNAIAVVIDAIYMRSSTNNKEIQRED